MKLGSFPRAALVLAASLLSVVAAAQVEPGSADLDIPENVRFVGKQDPNVRKATAIVNGEVITETDIEHRLNLLLGDSRDALPAEEMPRARAQILRSLIDESLQIQAAAQQEIEITEREISEYYAGLAQQNNSAPAALTEYLRSIGSSERSMRRQIRGILAWQRLRERWINPFVNVGEEEVQQVIDQLNASRGTSEYRVFEIFVSATPETATEVQANVMRMVEQIRGGAPFQALARQFSEASTAATGGDLGWVRAEQLPAELAALVTQMPAGAISDPIPVPGGFSVILLADTRQILVADARDAVLSLMQLAFTLPPGTTEAQARARADQLTQAAQTMGGCGGAAAAAQRIGAELTSNDQLPVRELPPQLQQILLGLNLGQATPAFGDTSNVRVLILCGRDDPEAAGTPSFDAVYDRIREERVARRAQRYLRDLRRDAVIDYR